MKKLAWYDNGSTRKKNPCGKMRKVNEPYEIYRSADGWEWRVLKKNQNPDKEEQNPYATWFCAVKSPFTHGSYDMGDTYKSSVVTQGVQIEFDPAEIECW